MKVSEVMTNPCIVVSNDTSVYNAAKVMQQHNIGSVPVLDENDKMVGIVTDRDMIIRNIARGLDPRTHRVNEIMTKHVHCVNRDSDIHDAARLMGNEQIRRLPVVDGDSRVVGMLALGDVAVTESCEEQAGSALCGISCGC